MLLGAAAMENEKIAEKWDKNLDMSEKSAIIAP